MHLQVMVSNLVTLNFDVNVLEDVVTFGELFYSDVCFRI